MSAFRENFWTHTINFAVMPVKKQVLVAEFQAISVFRHLCLWISSQIATGNPKGNANTVTRYLQERLKDT